MTESAAQWVHISELTPWEHNDATRDNEAAVQPVADMIDSDGWGAPIVVQTNGHIIAGHTRLKAARLLVQRHGPEWTVPGAPGAQLIPVRFVDVDDATAARMALADNRLGEIASWRPDGLADRMRELQEMDISLDGLGWSEGEIQALLAPPQSRRSSSVPAPPRDAQSELGTVYHLGPHRLVCGSATDDLVWQLLLGDELLDALWSDPPYGVAYVGKTEEALTIQNDDLSDEDLYTLLQAAYSLADGAMKPGAAAYVCFSDTRREVLKRVLVELGWFRHWLVWVKDVFVMGRADYHYQHEPIGYGWKPGAKHRWFGGRTLSTVIQVDRPKASREHPTMKPIELITQTLRNNVEPGDVVADPFGGSGSTLIAAHELGCRARLIELEPAYCDVIRQRWYTYATDAGIDPGPGALPPPE